GAQLDRAVAGPRAEDRRAALLGIRPGAARARATYGPAAGGLAPPPPRPLLRGLPTHRKNPGRPRPPSTPVGPGTNRRDGARGPLADDDRSGRAARGRLAPPDAVAPRPQGHEHPRVAGSQSLVCVPRNHAAAGGRRTASVADRFGRRPPIPAAAALAPRPKPRPAARQLSRRPGRDARGQAA